MPFIAQAQTPYRLALQFFDVSALIRADAETYPDLFARMYPRFRLPQTPADFQPDLDFTVLTRPDNPYGAPVILRGDQPQILNNPDLLQGYIYETIFHSLIASVRSHLLIHAGVVACRGQAILLVADAFHGKTTLTLELIRRGFKFLSDEMAAIHRSDGLVHPFPRSLRLRPGSLEMTGFAEAAIDAPVWLDKLLLDIEQIKPGCAGEPATIRHIFVLHDPAGSDESASAGADRSLHILLDRTDDAFLSAIRQIDGVSATDLARQDGYPLLKLTAAHKTRVQAQVEALCAEYQIIILDVIKRAENRPSFDQSPRVEPLTRSQTVMELLRRFQGGHKSALLQEEFGGNSTRLFLELASLIGDAACHRLSVGPLAATADLLCSTAGIAEGRCE